MTATAFESLILIAAAFLAALYGLLLSTQPPSIPRSVIKTASVALLALVAVLNGAPLLLIAALGFGALGDWLLSRPGPNAVLQAIAAFALAHVCLTVLMVQYISVLWPPAPVQILLLAVAALAASLLVPRSGPLKGAVLGYVIVITSLGWVALALPPELQLAALATWLFIFSDLLLGIEMFRLPADHWLRIVTGRVVWVSYWLAQLGYLLAFAPL